MFAVPPIPTPPVITKAPLDGVVDATLESTVEIELINNYFDANEVDEIWITFPDPQPQISREKKRLTHDRFLDNYKQILKADGIVHLKTDNDGLYEYTLERLHDRGNKIIKHTNDLYKEDWLDEVLSIQTTYEKKYRAVGKNINYIQFQL